MRNSDNKGSLSEKISWLAQKASEDLIPENKPTSWWLFILPGKLSLWIDYMFPDSIVGAIGSARRKDVPSIQILTTLKLLLSLFLVFLVCILALFLGK